jgi:predicted flap endonuclease-1-like 5' DNA nuclease
MGQPIHLEREDEKTVVYGMNQARIMTAQGWSVMNSDQKGAIGVVDDLTAIHGVGEVTAAVLANAGFNTYIKIHNAPTDELVALNGISPLSAAKIQKNAADLVKGNV